MNVRLVMGAVWLCWVACGQAGAAEPMTMRSHSGQFVVRGLSLGRPLAVAAPTSGVSYARLDPTLLAISCERIKAALLGELVMKDSWRGTIYITLHPLQGDQEPIVVTSVRFTDGWSYRVEMPEQLDRTRLVKAVVEVLLMEVANRNARSLPAELPLWLTEGLAAHLQATALANFTLEPGSTASAANAPFIWSSGMIRQERFQDPLGRVRERLRAHPPLTWNDLTWPVENQLSEENLEIYQSCAQLFVCELLRLDDGRACLREMLARLPDNLNWQTAFLRAFSGHFQGLLDVDKWWSLHVVHLTGQGFAATWPRQEICRQLNDILTTPVQVRVSAHELPLTTRVKLQNILAEWDFQRQQPVVRQKLDLLQALRLRATPDSVGLVDGYRQVLESYSQSRTATGHSGRKIETSPNVRSIVSEAIKRLDSLDVQRETLYGRK